MYYRNIAQHILQTFRSHTTYKPYSCFVIVIIIHFYSSKLGMYVGEDIMVKVFFTHCETLQKIHKSIYSCVNYRPLSLRNLYVTEHVLGLNTILGGFN